MLYDAVLPINVGLTLLSVVLYTRLTQLNNFSTIFKSFDYMFCFLYQGGLATKDEMCVSVLYYYPRHNVSICDSNPPEYQSVQVVDGLEYQCVLRFIVRSCHCHPTTSLLENCCA